MKLSSRFSIMSTISGYVDLNTDGIFGDWQNEVAGFDSSETNACVVVLASVRRENDVEAGAELVDAVIRNDKTVNVWYLRSALPLPKSWLAIFDPLGSSLSSSPKLRDLYYQEITRQTWRRSFSSDNERGKSEIKWFQARRAKGSSRIRRKLKLRHRTKI
ncbi:hypothetical protein K1719_026478 [Acacia pycnantha]|nr:hypothetical protein K1719_026478 [Acacia pycnantha]